MTTDDAEQRRADKISLQRFLDRKRLRDAMTPMAKPLNRNQAVQDIKEVISDDSI